jgi:hypothetical protein
MQRISLVLGLKASKEALSKKRSTETTFVSAMHGGPARMLIIIMSIPNIESMRNSFLKKGDSHALP